MKTLGNGSELNILMEAVLVNYGIDMTDLDSIAEELPGADVSFFCPSLVVKNIILILVANA